MFWINLGVGVNWYPGVNWSTTTIYSLRSKIAHHYVDYFFYIFPENFCVTINEDLSIFVVISEVIFQ